MSRIAKNNIKLPEDTICSFDNNVLSVKGKLGEATLLINDLFTIGFCPNLGIKFIKFVHSFIEPKISCNLWIASSTEYNSEEFIVKWFICSLFLRIKE